MTELPPEWNTAARLAVTYVSEQGARSSHILSIVEIAGESEGSVKGDEKSDGRIVIDLDIMDEEPTSKPESRRASKSRSKVKERSSKSENEKEKERADLRKRLEYTRDCLYDYYVARSPFSLAMR